MRDAEATRRAPARAEDARRADRDRRLRHRLQLARLPAPVPRRRAEDRPLVRQRRSPPRTSRRALIHTLVQLGKHARASRRSPRASRITPSSCGCSASSATRARASCSRGRSMLAPSRRSSRPPTAWPRHSRPSSRRCAARPAAAGSRAVRLAHRAPLELSGMNGAPSAMNGTPQLSDRRRLIILAICCMSLLIVGDGQHDRQRRAAVDPARPARVAVRACSGRSTRTRSCSRAC